MAATASAAIVMTSLAGCSASTEPPVTAPALPVVPQRRILRSVVTLGRSVRGRPIRAIVLGDPNAARPMLVVGCIHGNETAGIAVADRLAAGPPPRGSAIWIIRDLNPDGVAAGTRQNAHHVYLNRNFPFGWRPLGHPGDQQYAGPQALSEPESRLASKLILRLRPRLTIWFHPPLATTDRSAGDARVEARFAALSRLPLTRLPRYPGNVATWENHQHWDGTAFVVELPPARPTESAVARYANAGGSIGVRLLPTPRHLYQVWLEPDVALSRDELLDELTARRIGTGVHYRGVHLHPFYRDTYDLRPEQFPVATEISETTLSLPLSPKLTEADQDDVVVALTEALRR